MTRAIRFDKIGGPEVLAFQDVDLKAPGEGEVRVRHTAIGVNFIDTAEMYGEGGAESVLGQAIGEAMRAGEDRKSVV